MTIYVFTVNANVLPCEKLSFVLWAGKGMYIVHLIKAITDRSMSVCDKSILHHT